ncbi:zinc finger, C3HC4 type-domain-containing protein [Pilobolus umbonatus]|nr:zinc finger, C3HC4 type-domain-containing protein [Pilobolus umbonatus]
MQNMNSNELNQLTSKHLKAYLNAYNLPSKNVIEKGDLVKIIFNTRPLSNANEVYFRKYRKNFVTDQSEQEDNGFSLSNIVQRYFTSNDDDDSTDNSGNNSGHNQPRPIVNPVIHIPPDTIPQPPSFTPARPIFTATIITPTFNQASPDTSTFTPPPSTSPFTPPPTKKETLSIKDLCSSSTDPSSLSVRTIKSILKSNYVEHSHVIEKSELVKLVQRLMDQHKDTSDDSSSECRICYDAQQNCVFLDCGHMVTCMDCAKKLIETKNECPICREPIIKLVHVFRT